MHKGLEVLEIVRMISGNLDVPEAYRLALTCRTFLEPGLDEVWRDIVPFDPILACLPGDLWRREVVPGEEGEDPNTILHLRRDIKSQDLSRYITYYAPRIREIGFEIDSGMTIPSIESFHALQMATDYQPGALSPFLKMFNWFTAREAVEYFGEGIGRQISPYMDLFLGDGIEVLSASYIDADPPLHKASVQRAFKRLHRGLKDLTLSNRETLQFYAQLPWPKLEYIFAQGISIAELLSFPLIGQTPRVTVYNLGPPPREFGPDGTSNLPPNHKTLTGLLELLGWSNNLADVNYYLDRLPPTNTIRTVDYCGSSVPSLSECQEIVQAVGRQCNPITLSSLALKTAGYVKTPPEGFDLDPAQVDLLPLAPFRNLHELRFTIHQPIALSPKIIKQIPQLWPHLRCLILSPHFSSGRPPSINHVHILRLVRQLPALRDLGMVFDATTIMGPETTVTSPELHVLRVGCSPICSPSRVIQFLISSFPFLKTLDINRRREWGSNLYGKRWDAVSEGWEALRRGQS